MPRIIRPRPPEVLCRPGRDVAPSRELYEFIQGGFVDPAGPFWRVEYAHLEMARIGVLWTNVEKVKGMRPWIASAEMVTDSGDKWAIARRDVQLEEWFGHWWEDDPRPDFLLTFYAPSADEADDVSFCASVAHELRHCAHAEDRQGQPRFDMRTGRPVFALRDHDVTAWLSVAEDFGPVEANVPELMEVLARPPRFSGAQVSGICGTCLRVAA